MTIAAHAETLAAQGRVEEAFAQLSDAATRDADAAFMLANWRMSGQIIRRDLPESRRLYGIAAAQGHAQAAQHYVALLANGAGGQTRQWAEALEWLSRADDDASRRQLEILGAMEIDGSGDPLGQYSPDQVAGNAPIWTIPGFLTAAEAQFLVELAAPMLKPSAVAHPVTGQIINNPVRTSSAAAFPFIVVNPALHALNRRIAAATATGYAQGEPTQILSYAPGEEYKVHGDALPNERNQRVLTFLVYLTDGFDGGETAFPRWDFAFKGKVGDALFFRNSDSHGRPDLKMIHAGKPVDAGQKVILSKWIRHQPIALPGPPGRPF